MDEPSKAKAESRNPSRGEFVTLKEHFDSRLLSIEKSIEVANVVMQKRLDGMNEFRETLRDQAAKFTTRDELDLRCNIIDKRLKELEIAKATLDGKASQGQANIALIIGVSGLIVSIIGLLLKF